MFDADEVISIKDEPELRHALAHMYYAIEALAKGNRKEAMYELKSIESLIFWEDDEHMTRAVEGEADGLQQETEEENVQREAEVATPRLAGRKPRLSCTCGAEQGLRISHDHGCPATAS